MGTDMYSMVIVGVPAKPLITWEEVAVDVTLFSRRTGKAYPATEPRELVTFLGETREFSTGDRATQWVARRTKEELGLELFLPTSTSWADSVNALIGKQLATTETSRGGDMIAYVPNEHAIEDARIVVDKALMAKSAYKSVRREFAEPYVMTHISA